MKNEAGVWHQFGPLIPFHLVKRRVEDRSGALGTADVFIGGGGRCCWIELKHTETVNRKPTLRAGQASFAMDCWASGVPHCYMVGSRDNKVRIINSLWRWGDWRDHLEEEWPSFSEERVVALLKRLGVLSR